MPLFVAFALSVSIGMCGLSAHMLAKTQEGHWSFIMLFFALANVGFLILR